MSAAADRVSLARPAFVVGSRARASVALLATVLMMATLAATLAATVPTYGEAVVAASLRADVASAAPADAGIEVSMRQPAAGWGELVPAVSEVLDGAFAAPARSLVVGRSDAYTLPERFASGDTSLVTALAVVEGSADLLVDVAGSRGAAAGSGAAAAALHTEAAELLGLGVGDRVDLESRDGPVTVEIVALVEPADRTDPLWMDATLVVDGLTESGSFTEVGPFLVGAEAFESLPGGGTIRWRRTLAPDRVSPEAADRTAAGVSAVPRRLADDLDRADADVTTGLPGLVSGSKESIGAMSTVVGLVLAQVAGVALYGLALAAFALVDTRSTETALLRSRGATASQLGGLAAAEAALVVVPAVLAAPFLSRLVVDLLGRWGPAAGTGLDLRPGVPTAAWVAAAVVGLIAFAIVVAPAIRSARAFGSARSAPAGDGAERVPFLRRTGLDAALAAIAVFGLWQMARAGSVTATGQADPLLVAAPALGIVAVSLLLLRLFTGAATMTERAAASRRGAVPALAGWELARRPGRLGRIAVLVVLATAVGTFTAVHLASLRRSQVEQGDARVSADLVVTPDARSRSQVDQALLAGAYRATPGVSGAMPLDRQTVTFGTGPTAISGVTLVAVDATRAADMLRTPERLVGPAAEGWDTLHRPDDLDGIPLAPEGATRLAATATTTHVGGMQPGADDTVQVTFLVLDGDATIHRLVSPGLAPDGEPVELAFDLGGDVGGAAARFSGPIELIGLEARADPIALPEGLDPNQLGPEEAPPTIAVDVTDLRVDGVPVALEERAWALHSRTESSGSIIDPEASVASTAGALTVEVNPGIDFFGPARPARVTLGTSALTGDQPPPIPVMATPALSEELGVVPGDTVLMVLRGRPHEVEIVGVVEAVPFAVEADMAVLADWATLNTRRYVAERATAVPSDWALAVDDEDVEAASGTLLNDPFRSVAVSGRERVSDDIGRDPTTVGLSGSLILTFVAALAVAVIGMVLTAVTGARHRRPGSAILRALGVHRGELRRMLVLETLPLVVVAAIAGVLTGIGLARLSLRSVAIAPDGSPAIPAPLLVVPWPAVAGIAGLVVLAGALLPLVTARLLGRRRPADEIRFGEVR